MSNKEIKINVLFLKEGLLTELAVGLFYVDWTVCNHHKKTLQHVLYVTEAQVTLKSLC